MKYLEAFIISCLAVFAPITTALVALLVLIAADTLTGVISAKKRGEPITSAGLRRSISKLIIYELAIALSYLAEHYLMSDFMPVMKIISGMIGMVELKSILENLNEISGTNLLSAMISKLGSSNGEK